MQRGADGHGDARADHRGGEAADGVGDRADGDDGRGQKADVQLLAEGIEDGAHQQRAEQALRHGAERVHAVLLEGADDALAGEKGFEFIHSCALPLL